MTKLEIKSMEGLQGGLNCIYVGGIVALSTLLSFHVVGQVWGIAISSEAYRCANS